VLASKNHDWLPASDGQGVTVVLDMEGDLYLGSPYLLSPQTLYECLAEVPNVVFPCVPLYDEPTGRIALLDGGTDSVTAIAFAYLKEVLDWLKTKEKGGRG